MYKVICSFADAQDDGHVYLTGDTYPREGYEPTAERIIELASTENGRGFPLINEVEEEIPFTDDTPVTEQPMDDVPGEPEPEAEPPVKEKPVKEKPKTARKPRTSAKPKTAKNK